MNDAMFLLAQRVANSPISLWLKEYPLVVGSIAIVLGALVARSGVIMHRTGVAKYKLGMTFRGGAAQVSGYILQALGSAVCVFGLYKVIKG